MSTAIAHMTKKLKSRSVPRIHFRDKREKNKKGKKIFYYQSSTVHDFQASRFLSRFEPDRMYINSSDFTKVNRKDSDLMVILIKETSAMTKQQSAILKISEQSKQQQQQDTSTTTKQQWAILKKFWMGWVVVAAAAPAPPSTANFSDDKAAVSNLEEILNGLSSIPSSRQQRGQSSISCNTS